MPWPARISIRWVADYLTLNLAPCPLWELPADVVDEIRWVMNEVIIPHRNKK